MSIFTPINEKELIKHQVAQFASEIGFSTNLDGLRRVLYNEEKNSISILNELPFNQTHSVETNLSETVDRVFWQGGIDASSGFFNLLPNYISFHVLYAFKLRMHVNSPDLENKKFEFYSSPNSIYINFDSDTWDSYGTPYSRGVNMSYSHSVRILNCTFKNWCPHENIPLEMDSRILDIMVNCEADSFNEIYIFNHQHVMNLENIKARLRGECFGGLRIKDCKKICVFGGDLAGSKFLRSTRFGNTDGMEYVIYPNHGLSLKDYRDLMYKTFNLDESVPGWSILYRK